MPPLLPRFSFAPKFALRVIIVLAGLILGTAAAIAAEPVPVVPVAIRPLAQRDTLIVGAITDSYPYGYIRTDGEYAGFSVDLLDAVARAMNLRIKRVLLPNLQLQERFKQGEFDILQGLTQTPGREAFADFSIPYLTLQSAIFVQKRGPINRLEDLNGKKFAMVGSEGVAAQYLRDRGLEVQSVVVSSVEKGLRLVSAGDCAGVFASNLTALSLMDHIGITNVRMLGTPIADHDLRNCFAVHEGDAQLLARLDEGLAILRSTGEFKRIYLKWFGRIDGPMVAGERVRTYGMVGLIVAFLAAVMGLLHQRKLRQQIAGQAAKLSAQTAELARQKALLQALYDNIPMAMCVLDHTPAGFHILSINRQAEPYFGLTAIQVTGRMLTDLSPRSEWISHLADLLQRGLAERTLSREERRLTAANKRLIFTIVPMTPDDDGHARLCVLAEDITERRNLDDEIAQSRKLRAVGELVGGIAHEFNNLLTPITLEVEQIQLDWAHEPTLIAETRLIAEAVKRAAELTRRLLAFGRKTDHGVEEVHLRPVIENCFSLLRLTMDRRIQWEHTVPPDLPPLYFSATDLNQIILNLVINARDTLMQKLATKGSDWTPRICVEAALLPAEPTGPAEGSASHHRVHGWQRLSISDNGMGMTPAVRERIFEPFFTTKEVGKGTGLGLATVWHMVTSISGRIEVESTPGEGTTFHLYLPMLPPPAQVAAPRPPASPNAASARILLAEDDPMVARAVTSPLRRHGHKVTHLTDGAAVWEHLQAHWADYDLLILDVNMPGMDGIELAARVRASGRYSGRIMIASGRLSSDDLDQISAAQVDAVLNKPFANAELTEAVRRCLAGRGAA